MEELENVAQPDKNECSQAVGNLSSDGTEKIASDIFFDFEVCD